MVVERSQGESGDGGPSRPGLGIVHVMIAVHKAEARDALRQACKGGDLVRMHPRIFRLDRKHR